MTNIMEMVIERTVGEWAWSHGPSMSRTEPLAPFITVLNVRHLSRHLSLTSVFRVKIGLEMVHKLNLSNAYVPSLNFLACFTSH